MTSASTSSKTAVPPVVAQTSQTQLELNRLPQRPFPPADKCWLHGQQPGNDEVSVVVEQSALRQIAQHSNSDLGVELGGALLGHAYRSDQGVVVEIKAALPMLSDDHGPIHFTFTADAWSQLQRDRETHHPNLEMVGWFHTHPALGVFYSSDDVVVHSAAFTQPWHVGLVIDPVSNESCFFGWTQAQLAPLPGYYELLSEQNKPVIPWRVVKTSVWDREYTYDDYAQRTGSDVYLANNPRPALGSFGTQMGLIVGALALIISFIMLVGWVMPLTKQVNQLETVAITLADQALQETNAATCPDPDLRIISPVIGATATIGSRVSIIGTANHPDAARYRTELRPTGVENWALLKMTRRATDLGELANWQTTDYAPGVYEIRLIAVDRNNVRLAYTAPCAIAIELTQ